MSTTEVNLISGVIDAALNMQRKEKKLTVKEALEKWMLPRTYNSFIQTKTYKTISGFLKEMDLPNECWLAFKNMSIPQIQMVLDGFVALGGHDAFAEFLICLNPDVRKALGIFDDE